ncbi:hypothetical protein OROMI_014933 [Orobanche minor]
MAAKNHAEVEVKIVMVAEPKGFLSESDSAAGCTESAGGAAESDWVQLEMKEDGAAVRKEGKMDFVENLPLEEELIGVEIEARARIELFQKRIRQMFL